MYTDFQEMLDVRENQEFPDIKDFSEILDFPEILDFLDIPDSGNLGFPENPGFPGNKAELARPRLQNQGRAERSSSEAPGCTDLSGSQSQTPRRFES